MRVPVLTRRRLFSRIRSRITRTLRPATDIVRGRLAYPEIRMLSISNVSKSFGGRRVLDGLTFTVSPGEVVGLIGPNGSGKSTLLNIVAGIAPTDGGSVTAHGAGYLRQGHASDASRSAADVFPAAFAARQADARVAELAAALANTPAGVRANEIEREYEAALALASDEDTAADAWRSLELRSIAPDEPVARLSGGELTKLGLIDLVARHPAALLLDEPTNNLDLPSLDWLDAYLDDFAGPVLLVSHDRTLLDRYATRIVELLPATGRVEFYEGGYTDFAEEKARREADLWARYRRQQEREDQLKREVRTIGDTARRRERISQNDFYRGRNKKFARRGVMLRRKLEREMASDDHIDRPQRSTYRVKAELSPVARGGDRMLAAEGLRVSAGGRTLLLDCELSTGWGEHIVIVGANGSGKTTLLRALVGEHPLDAGSVRLSPSAKIGYLPQEEAHETSAEAERTPVDLIRSAAALSETEARRFLHRFLFSGDGALTPIGRLSYGERRRLALAQLVLGGANIAVARRADEPPRPAVARSLRAGARELRWRDDRRHARPLLHRALRAARTGTGRRPPARVVRLAPRGVARPLQRELRSPLVHGHRIVDALAAVRDGADRVRHPHRLVKRLLVDVPPCRAAVRARDEDLVVQRLQELAHVGAAAARRDDACAARSLHRLAERLGLRAFLWLRVVHLHEVRAQRRAEPCRAGDQVRVRLIRHRRAARVDPEHRDHARAMRLEARLRRLAHLLRLELAAQVHREADADDVQPGLAERQSRRRHSPTPATVDRAATS